MPVFLFETSDVDCEDHWLTVPILTIRYGKKNGLTYRQCEEKVYIKQTV